MHPHFMKGDGVALPQLGLLTSLAGDEFKPEMTDAPALTDQLEADLSEMLAEHRTIAEALQKPGDGA